MTHMATGTFEVHLRPQEPDSESGGEAIARLVIDKTFAGDLDAVSKGQMLACNTAVEGSAGYVAMELVTGSLGGRSGSFVLQHRGTMDRGTPALLVIVVPDSATGDLTGLTGEMSIEIDDGAHSYAFEYTLPAI